MKTQAQCSCSSAPKLIFPCSGASDVGGLSDQAARQMTKDGTGKMYCQAGIGGRRGRHHGEHESGGQNPGD